MIKEIFALSLVLFAGLVGFVNHFASLTFSSQQSRCFCFFSAQTNAIDQAALIAIWNGLTSKESLGWNTAASLCGQADIVCTNQKVVEL